ncbi:MAG TPA: M28 family peptidase [Thermoanaerobaculia bacterium]|nr:M28 family peptidase [Thermoanaerobaculia bacterium]
MSFARRIALAVAVVVVAAAIWRRGFGRDPLMTRAARLDGLISPERLGRQMDALAGKPHRAGTNANREAVDALALRLRSIGTEVAVDEVPADLPEPVQSSLSLVAPERLDFDLRERPLGNEALAKAAETEIPYFAWAPDADVTAPLVYGNYGTREDYALLKRSGVSPAGKLVLLRGQGICRSQKALFAAEEGAAGLLLYPDPRDQGFRKPAYPDGPHANAWTVQRGSMLGYFLYPGDPAAAAAKGFETRPRVPALPISAGVAAELLRRLDGPPAPPDAAGGLGVPYRLGPGPAVARLVSRQRLERRTLSNLSATLRSGFPVAAPVIVGGHTDAWVFGTVDPLSGTAAVVETAEAVAGLVKGGLRLRRDVVFVLFDGEEYGMLGSTAFVAARLPALAGAAAFVYVDSAVRAPDFTADVAPGLRRPLDEILSLLRDPVSEKVLSEVRGAHGLPGFSGDTSPFQGLAGVPCVELGFGKRTYPLYHSVYDGPDLFRRFIDPGYRYEALLARILSLYVASLAEAPVVPYRFSEVASSVEEALHDLSDQHPLWRGSSQRKRLDEAARRLGAAGLALEASAAWKGETPRAAGTEKSLLAARAAFFRGEAPFGSSHLLVGPSEANGCGAEALPGLARALRSGDAARVEAETRALEQALDRASGILTEATGESP